jgi:hypothetical protein
VKKNKTKNLNERKSTRSKVIKVKILNINLDQLSKDLEVKFGRIIKEYKVLPFSKLKRKWIFLKSYGVEDSNPYLVFYHIIFIRGFLDLYL